MRPGTSRTIPTPEFDQLLTQAEGILDPKERSKVMAKIEAIMQDDGPIVQPFWRVFSTVMDKKVKGFELHPSQYIFAHQYAIAAPDPRPLAPGPPIGRPGSCGADVDGIDDS